MGDRCTASVLRAAGGATRLSRRHLSSYVTGDRYNECYMRFLPEKGRAEPVLAVKLQGAIWLPIMTRCCKRRLPHYAVAALAKGNYQLKRHS